VSVEHLPWVVVFAARSSHQTDEAGFVLRAIGIEYVITQLDGAWQLSVPASSAMRASEELAAYRAEGASARPKAPSTIEEVENGWAGVTGFVAVVLLVAVAANQDFFGQDWLGRGRLDVDRVRAGEWWRTITALCLHVDTAHLAGNVAFGGFFGLYIARYVGSGVAWLGIVLGGTLGNALNALVQPSGHVAIGASTAVFAALGMLAAFTWRRGAYRSASWRTRAAPLTAALGLLAFTGTGGGTAGGNVDIIAHLTGFVAGLGLGVLLATRRLPRQPMHQRWAGALAVAALTGAWLWAFATA
jgi:membrane associated rhomboid family serine protease